MRTIKILNWILSILGAFIVIALIVLVLPWERKEPEKQTAPTDRQEETTLPEPAAPGLPEAVPLDQAAPGDYVLFGRYEQDAEAQNGPEEIKWLVLDGEDGWRLLISGYALDCQPYYDDNRYVAWNRSTIREWLNGSFYEEAFDETERMRILTTTVTADKNEEYDSPAGPDTEDKVFLLSLPEAEAFFSSNEDRSCWPTPYARAQGAYANAESGICWWWLRTPGSRGHYAAAIGDLGDLYPRGLGIQSRDVAVRPVIRVKAY